MICTELFSISVNKERDVLVVSFCVSWVNMSWTDKYIRMLESCPGVHDSVLF